MKKKPIKHLIEAIFLYIFYYFFKIIGIDAASAIGGFLGRNIGYRTSITNKARKNLKLVMPELSKTERENILRKMWDNLGRTFAEFPHIPNLIGEKFEKRIIFTGDDNVKKAVAKGKGFIVFSGHFANWEIGPHSMYAKGYPLAMIYRRANNKYSENLIQKTRKKTYEAMFPKGKKGARELLRHLKNNGYAGMLIDQKMNEGISVPFFGKQAMTAPATADFAKKFGTPLLPANISRQKGKGAYFQVDILPELNIEGKKREEIMTEINAMFESWIRKEPEKWLWLHKRWKNEDYT